MNKKDVKNAEDLEKYYNKVRKIKFSDDIEIKSLNDVYDHLFGKYGGNLDATQQDTYFKKGRIHCNSGSRYRSFDDFFNLCKNYFPTISLKEISLFLKEKEVELQKTYTLGGFGINYCNVIRKYNLWGYRTNYAKIKDIEELPFNKEFPNVSLKLKDLIT